AGLSKYMLHNPEENQIYLTMDKDKVKFNFCKLNHQAA
ncbi:uncharacterized protein METZ01_LOCUS188278, partial [marine metagenome]